MKFSYIRIVRKIMEALFLTPLLWGSSAHSQNLSPDLILFFSYNQSNVSELESKFEEFAKINEFNALNKTKFVKERGHSTPYSTEIIAINSAHVIMSLSKLGYNSNIYNISLTTHPPTVHDRDLENKIRDFIESKIISNVINARISDNEAGSAIAFDKLLTTYQSWFRQASDIK